MPGSYDIIPTVYIKQKLYDFPIWKTGDYFRPSESVVDLGFWNHNYKHVIPMRAVALEYADGVYKNDLDLDPKQLGITWNVKYEDYRGKDKTKKFRRLIKRQLKENDKKVSSTEEAAAPIDILNDEFEPYRRALIEDAQNADKAYKEARGISNTATPDYNKFVGQLPIRHGADSSFTIASVNGSTSNPELFINDLWSTTPGRAVMYHEFGHAVDLARRDLWEKGLGYGIIPPSEYNTELAKGIYDNYIHKDEKQGNWWRNMYPQRPEEVFGRYISDKLRLSDNDWNEFPRPTLSEMHDYDKYYKPGGVENVRLLLGTLGYAKGGTLLKHIVH